MQVGMPRCSRAAAWPLDQPYRGNSGRSQGRRIFTFYEIIVDISCFGVYILDLWFYLRFVKLEQSCYYMLVMRFICLKLLLVCSRSVMGMFKAPLLRFACICQSVSGVFLDAGHCF